MVDLLMITAVPTCPSPGVGHRPSLMLWSVHAGTLLDLLDALAAAALNPVDLYTAVIDAARNDQARPASGQRFFAVAPTDEVTAAEESGARIAYLDVRNVEHDPDYDRYTGAVLSGSTFEGLLYALIAGQANPAVLREQCVRAMDARIPEGGCCIVCGEHGETRAEAVRAWREATRREADRRGYPFAVVGRVVHRSACRRVPAVGEGPARSLAEYVHGPGRDRRVVTPTPVEDYRYLLTGDEVHRWVTRRLVVPRAERHRRCRLCRPELPQRLSTE